MNFASFTSIASSCLRAMPHSDQPGKHRPSTLDATRTARATRPGRGARVWMLMVLAALLWPAIALHAQQITCSASMSGLVFGTVDPLASQTDASATLAWTCSKGTGSTRAATVCFNIEAGVQSGANTNPRRMLDGSGNPLLFQLYQDAGHSLVWGGAASATPLMISLALASQTTQSGTATLYGRVNAGQTAAVSSPSYQDQFSGLQTSITINETSGTTPPGSCAGTVSGTGFAFTASATVSARCSVTATTLDFGSVGLLGSATDASSTIGVQCATGVAYQVGLDAGLNGANVNARHMALAGSLVGYQLYTDAPRTLVWGNTPGSNTVAGTGNGSVRNLSVYGRVPAQTTPTAGTYADTITVTVTY